MIESVIFDMDGLLIDSEPFWREAEKEVFARVGLNLTDAMCESVMGLRIAEVIEHWYRLYPWPNPDFKAIESDILARVSHYISTRGVLMDGVSETFRFFTSRNIPMALASASPRQLIEVFLNRFQLHSYFRVIHSAENESYGKPHPAVFLTTADRLQVHPTRILVFEDSFNGLIAAKAARMKTVVVPAPEVAGRLQWKIADVQLNSLTEWNGTLWNSLNANDYDQS